jgi:hypothetical protein
MRGRDRLVQFALEHLVEVYLPETDGEGWFQLHGNRGIGRGNPHLECDQHGSDTSDVALGHCAEEKKMAFASADIQYLLPLHDYPFRKDHTIGPFSGGLPKTVEVGQMFSVYFIPDHEGLARDDYDRIGFSDTFGKYHWASKRDVLRARKSIREACDKVGKSYTNSASE